MKLLIGLGNPGDKYQYNRHNVGYHFVEFAIAQLTNIELTDFKLVKTDVFMNLSGKFVKKILKKHQNVSMDDLYIVHDDLDIPLGKFKIDHATGPKLHNGIKSIEETLKTKDFWRIRIGVDNREKQFRVHGEQYVLSNFTSEELKITETVFINIVKKLTG